MAHVGGAIDASSNNFLAYPHHAFKPSYLSSCEDLSQVLHMWRDGTRQGFIPVVAWENAQSHRKISRPEASRELA
jgi:hypothetical protein